MKQLLYLMLIFPIISFAQGREISGKIFDEHGAPLPGASITVTGINLGTTSDFDGVFKLKVPENAKTISISYLGYKDKLVEINSSNNYLVLLEVDTNNLDEIVVVGYGTQRKSDITGAVTSVEVNEAAVAQNTTIDQLLQGKAAGVQVSQNGVPGSGVTVRIRNGSSLRGNNEPLYVIDGIIISSAGEDANVQSGGNESMEPQNGLNGINPRDIESIEILKDASATAIYGSRGANGVVLITTKKGKTGETKINVFQTTSISKINERIDLLDGVDYASYRNEVETLNGNNPIFHIDDSGNVFNINSGEIGNIALGQVNWHDEIFKTAFSTNSGVNFSGGSEKGNFFVSTNYNNLKGIVDNSNFKSGNLNANLYQNLSDRLKMNLRLGAFYGKGQFAQDGNRVGGNRSFIAGVSLFNPLIDSGDDGFDTDLGLSSPYTWVNDFQDVSEEQRFIGNFSLIYNLGIKGLKYKIQAGGNIRDKTRDRFYGPTTFQGSTQNGFLQSTSINTKSYQINNLLMYSRRFSKKHRINAVLGTTYDVRHKLFTRAEFTYFSTFQFGYTDPSFAANTPFPLQKRRFKEELISFLGRGTYTLKDRYVFTGTLRVDGSSKFTEGNKYGYFPSFAFAWQAKKENFLKNSYVVSNLKLRAGWGQVGNQGIQPYQTSSNYNNTIYGEDIAFFVSNIGNKDLTWETTSQTNLGVDFGFFKNRFTGSIDVYEKETKDLLQILQIPESTGFSSLLVNGGSIENRGLEFALSGVLIDNKKDFNVELSGNIAFNRSKITNLENSPASIIINGEQQQRSFYFGDNISSSNYFNSPANVFIEGEEIGLFIGYETDGIWQSDDTDLPTGFEPGDVRIVDQNEDGIINAEDRTIIGNPNPDFVYGANLSVNYKSWSLSVLINGVYGNDIANGTSIRLTNPIGEFTNITPETYFNAWSPDNPSNIHPRIGYDFPNGSEAIEDRIIEDGSFLRINNITLGYDIPIENSNLFSQANIYVSGINLFTFTNYSGYNPEITSFLWNGNILGVDWSGAPNVSSVLLGLNINF